MLIASATVGKFEEQIRGLLTRILDVFKIGIFEKDKWHMLYGMKA
jgi:hypothetical protein